jgi:hypothetical protein
MKQLGVVSFVVGVALAVFFGILLLGNLPSTPQPVSGGVIHLDKDGLKLWASRPGAEPACVVMTADGDEVALETTGSESLTINNKSFYLVARSVDVVPAGDYAVNCSAAGPGTAYSVGPRVSIATFVLSILGVVFSLIIFIGLGIGLMVGGGRKKRRNQPPTGPVAPQYGQPGGPQYPQPGPPQQGNTFPGYPPPSSYNPGPKPDRPQDRPQDR